MTPAVAAILVCLATPPAAAPDAGSALHQWGSWRGPLHTVVAPHADPPEAWSETKNVKWKVALPGLGHSTPVIWGDRIYLTTAEAYGQRIEHDSPEHHHHHHIDEGAHDNFHADRRQRFMVVALDRSNGRVVWQTTVRDELPHEGTHETGSWASNSPVTDGKRIFASFGSRGLYALDLKGRVLWDRDFGHMTTRHGHGEGSSPALYGSTLVLNWDHEGDSFIVAVEADTGRTKWKTPRDEMTSWSTPLIVESDKGLQVVVAATSRIRGYDLATGRQIWSCGGLSRNVVASPLYSDGMVIAANSYDWQAMMAIRLKGAQGEIADTDAVAWKLDRHTPYVPSPLLYGGRLYFVKHLQAFISCADATSGRVLYGPQRLTGMGMIFASPVGAGGRVYVVSRNGTCMVLRDGSTFEVLAVNRLDDTFSASPAPVGRELFLRGERYLYCLSSGAGQGSPPTKQTEEN